MKSIIFYHLLKPKKTYTFLLILVLSSCNLYKLSKYPLVDDRKISNYIKNNKTTIHHKYIIIHEDEQLYAVENFNVIDSVYSGKLTPIDSTAKKFYESSLVKKRIEIPYKNKKYGNQLHFDIKNLEVNESNEFNFNKSQITKIRTLEKTFIPIFVLFASFFFIIALLIVGYIVSILISIFNYIFH